MADPGRPAAGPPRPAELKARLEAERRGTPFLVFRDAADDQVIFDLDGAPSGMTIGRRADNDLAFPWDDEVSRVHAQLERLGGDWAVVDDGLSRNGTFVNGERVPGRRRLRDGDRLCFGETPVLFRAPSDDELRSTAAVAEGQTPIPLTPAQHRVAVALCRPLTRSAYATPATNQEIGDEVHLSVDAVKAHLRVLFERFGLHDLPQNTKRARLAAILLLNGLVRQHDF